MSDVCRLYSPSGEDHGVMSVRLAESWCREHPGWYYRRVSPYR